MNWNKITKSKEVISLLKRRILIENRIRMLDKDALINYELEALQH